MKISIIFSDIREHDVFWEECRERNREAQDVINDHPEIFPANNDNDLSNNNSIAISYHV